MMIKDRINHDKDLITRFRLDISVLLPKKTELKLLEFSDDRW